MKMIKLFRNFRITESKSSSVTEGQEVSLRLKDIISIPGELNDIYGLCKNEFNLSGGDTMIGLFYIRILSNCLMQYYGLTRGGVDFISEVRKNLTNSSNEREVKFQYKKLSNPKTYFSVSLLKMIVDCKQVSFVDEDLLEYNPSNVIDNLLKSDFENATSYTKTHRNRLLSAEIRVGF